MKLRKAILLSYAIIEDFLNDYDHDLGPFLYPGRYLYGGFIEKPDHRRAQKCLSGLVADGLLKRRANRNDYYLTGLGWEKVGRILPWREVVKRPWDGLWRVVVYDIAEERKVERNFLRRRLKELGFRLWQKSTWITPHDVSLELYRLLKNSRLVGRVSVFESRNLFGLGDRRLAAKTWPVEKLGDEYRKIIAAWQTGKRHDCKTGPLKDLARRLQHRYLELLITDPGLPTELLPPDWPTRELETFLAETSRCLAT